MKREPDIVREVLLKVEEAESGQSVSMADFENETRHQLVAYHVHLLHESGYIEAAMIPDYMGGQNHWAAFSINRMTMDGHDLLDAIRSEGVWSRTKEAIVSAGGVFTMESLKAVATGIAAKLLKEAAGL